MPKNLYYNKEFADKMVLAEKIKQLEYWKLELFYIDSDCKRILKRLEDFIHEPFYKTIEEIREQALKEIDMVNEELFEMYREDFSKTYGEES